MTPPALIASGWLMAIRHLTAARDSTSSERASRAAGEWARAEAERYQESLNRIKRGTQ